jgi:DNA-binding SARP family transcriptional activator
VRPLHLRLLDRFELTAQGRPLVLPFTAQRVMAFLALAGGPVLRQRVAGTLWGERSGSRANANLRSALWRLNAYGPGLIEPTPTHLRPGPEVVVDFHEAVRVARQAADPATGVDRPGAEEWLRHDLLPDWDEEWLEPERQRFRQLRLHALERLCDRYTAVGRYDRAVEVGQLALAADDLRETAHRALIKAYLAEGNRPAAVRQYRLYTRLLREELGAEPSSAVSSLVGAL